MLPMCVGDMHVCAHVHACVYLCVFGVGHWVPCSITICHSLPRQGISPNLRSVLFSGEVGWSANPGNLPVSCAAIAGAHCPAWLSTSVLGIWTWAFILMQQELLAPRPSPSSLMPLEGGLVSSFACLLGLQQRSYTWSFRRTWKKLDVKVVERKLTCDLHMVRLQTERPHLVWSQNRTDAPLLKPSQ